MLPGLPELTYFRLLHGVELDAIEQFLEVCQEVSVPAGTLLMVEGEEDRGMALVVEGVLEVYVGQEPSDVVVRRALRGDMVGELSVLGLTEQRSASVRVAENSVLLVLEPEGLARLRRLENPFVDNLEEAVLQELARDLRETDRMLARLAVGAEIKAGEPHGLWERLADALGVSDRPWGSPPDLVEVLRRSPEFHDVPGELAEHLADQLEARSVGRGETVIREGELGDSAWIVADGKVGVYRATTTDRFERVGELTAGTVFGHLAIIDGSMCTASCVVEEPGWLFRVPKHLVNDVVHRHTPAARALRWGFLRALFEQLGSANRSLVRLTAQQEGKAAEDPDLDERVYADLAQARMASVGPT